MSQYFLSLPHDSEEEPTMATMDPAELEEAMAKAGPFQQPCRSVRVRRTAGCGH